jgi:PIN domain nuclease of toxin-antitoxin system
MELSCEEKMELCLAELTARTPTEDPTERLAARAAYAESLKIMTSAEVQAAYDAEAAEMNG